MSTHQRLDLKKTAPDAYRAVMPLQQFASTGPVEETTIVLVQIRASQINGCAWCLDMHMAEAREAGVAQRRLDLVATWRESGDLFTPRERAALALAEQVTLISEQGVTDEVWAQVQAQFDERESVQLLMAASVINVWNRMNVTAQTQIPKE